MQNVSYISHQEHRLLNAEIRLWYLNDVSESYVFWRVADGQHDKLSRRVVTSKRQDRTEGLCAVVACITSWQESEVQHLCLHVELMQLQIRKSDVVVQKQYSEKFWNP